jgi:hypothetical protein
MATVAALFVPTASSAVKQRRWRAAAASSSAASGVDLKALESAIDKVRVSVTPASGFWEHFSKGDALVRIASQKSSDDVKEALEQLKELGWAKRWSSQPYVSRRTVSALSSQFSSFQGAFCHAFDHVIVCFICEHLGSVFLVVATSVFCLNW